MRFPKEKKSSINTRESTITNAFVQAIIPTIEPQKDEIEKILSYLGIEDTSICAYCGGEAKTWDHFRPLVKNKKPTGFITEINNMVPACSTCNSSKGNKDWQEWLDSKSTNSLSKRGFDQSKIDEIKKRLKTFEEKTKPINISNKIEEYWKDYDKLRQAVINKMSKGQKKANNILSKLKKELSKEMNNTNSRTKKNDESIYD